MWHCWTHHLFHAPLYFANDAWRCNVANLTALPMLKGYSPLIKAEVRPFIASSSPLIVLGVSQSATRIINGNSPGETERRSEALEVRNTHLKKLAMMIEPNNYNKIGSHHVIITQTYCFVDFRVTIELLLLLFHV